MLKTLQVENLRNLESVQIALSPRLNIFYGENGSGKTSLLEAVNLIGLGRSFRSLRPKPIIRYQATELTSFALVVQQGVEHKIGVQKTLKGEALLRVDGKNALSAARLAELTPVLAMNADSFELVSGAAKHRRQLLDWLAFHVEPLFLDAWRAAQDCLKQRNSLLRRDKIRALDLRPWDLQLQQHAEQIHRIRNTSFQMFAASLDQLRGDLPEGDFSVDYRPGWDTSLNLMEVLADSFEKDVDRGYTYYGPHRCDLHIGFNQHKAADVLSRGQQKILVCALIVAQGQAFTEQKGHDCVFLVDDLPAELDFSHQQLLGRWLSQMQTQVLITGVEKDALLRMWPAGALSDAHVFHVKHGKVERDTKTTPITR